MHQPHPIDIAAKASGEPVFREVGVGPWAETHPGEPRPDDPQSVNYDRRFDSSLLDEGDRRNVLDQYRYWAVAAIKADLDARGRHDFEVAVENWTHDFNIGSMVRTANAFQAKRVHIVGPHKWNRKGSLMTELYQHVENHPSITELVECWKLRIAGGIAAAQSQAAAIAFRMHESAGKNVEAGNDAGVSDALLAEGRVAGCAPSGISTDASDASGVGNGFEPTCMAQLAAIDQRIAELKAARVIALDIIPGAVPMETYRFPKRCLMLFGAEGPGLSEKALELADDVVYISQFGSVRSINAGAAAAVSMHAWISRARRSPALTSISYRPKSSSDWKNRDDWSSVSGMIVPVGGGFGSPVGASGGVSPSVTGEAGTLVRCSAGRFLHLLEQSSR